MPGASARGGGVLMADKDKREQTQRGRIRNARTALHRTEEIVNETLREDRLRSATGTE
jgi:hypothetical protein